METTTTTTTGKVKFGITQLFNPTPTQAKNFFRFVLYGLTIVNVALTIFTDIPQHVKDVVGRYSLELTAFVHFITKLFGIEESK